MEALAVSIACLHPLARVAFACGFAAAALKPLRWASNEERKAGATCGAFAAMLVKQASYFLMYSSHSATPTESPVEAVEVFAALFAAVVFVVVVVVVVVFVTVDVFARLAAVLVVLLVAAPPHPAETTARQSPAITNRKLLIFI